jgi:hypothetical protein
MKHAILARRAIGMLAALSVLLAACGGTSSEGSVAAPNDVVITVRVADAEEYRIRLTDANDIAIARKLLVGEAAPHIPNGQVVRGEPDVNVRYTWHIDPASVEFADTTTEVCDGRPSDVERGAISSDRYCPWSAKVVAIAVADAR